MTDLYEATNDDGAQENWPEVVDLIIELPGKKTISLPDVSTSETLNAIRQALADFQETAFLTSFKWELTSLEDLNGDKLEKVQDSCNDFSELNSLIQANVKKCHFKLVEEPYDAKKVRVHVKRIKDISVRSYLVSAAPKNKASQSEANPETNEEGVAEDKGNDERKVDALPKFEKIHEPIHFGEFFQQALQTSKKSAPTTTSGKDVVKCDSLNAVIKNVFLSGWNPPPSNRRMQGDLMYLEVTLATEGTVYITATSRGFYVNRSNRNNFDPRPASQPHYNHNLFNTLLSHSVSVRTAWSKLCDYSNTMTFFNTEGPLEPFGTQLKTFDGDVNTLPPTTWLFAADMKGSDNYDLFRAQEYVSDLHGIEELGAPREWNDEIQSIRSLPANELGEKVVKARLEYRIIADFTENCKKVVLAISEGLIAPLTYSDPNQSNIFVYNGIFVSRAEDIKDAFHGEEASRKATARDLTNQKLIKALEIEGLGTVLCTVIDYKGIRYVAQSIIPGIFNQGENCAQLCYGVLEPNKNLTVKNTTLKIYQEIATKLSLAERNIPIQPIQEEKKDEASTEGNKEEEGNAHIDPLSKLLKQVDSNQAPPIKVDEVDNIAMDETTQSIRHVGAVESKMIKGADGRLYAIEFMRLTPRDANYVQGEKGTKKLSEELLAKGDASLYSTYLLRQELMSLFIHRKINLARQALLLEAANKEKAMTASATPEEDKTAATETNKDAKVDQKVEEDVDGDNEENRLEIVKEDEAAKKATEAPVIDEALQNSLATEYAEKFRAITPQSLQLEFNVNCFYHFPADINNDVLAKDEELIREVSLFLFDHILPMVTRQIREGEFFPRDLTSMIQYLHRMGINVRYLGHLATLAMEQERDDSELFLTGKQRIHTMPFYWLEFLLIEMIARSVKHMLNGKLRHDPLLAAAPGATIASLLNHVVSLLSEPLIRPLTATTATEGTTGEETKASTTTTNTTSATAANATSGKKKKKKGGKGDAGMTPESSVSLELLLSTTEDPQVNGFVSRADCLQELSKTLMDRFLYRFGLLEELLHPEVPLEETDKATNNFLRSRLSPTMLISRICQQCGIVLAAKSYPFRQTNTPFTAEDIIGLVPKVKSSEPETYLPEYTEILNTSVEHLQQGNPMAAFETAQQAVNIINQITGPNHLHAFQATDQLSAVLINSTTDLKAAISMASRALLLSAQTFGLDSQETILHWIQLGILYTECGYYDVAFQYYQTAKYYLQLIAGDHHPELANIYMRFAALYEKLGDIDSALKSLFRARIYTNDLFKSCMLTISIASVYYHHGYIHEAVTTQKNGYKIFKELVKNDDERLIEVKKNLEVYLRASLTIPADHRYPVSPDEATLATMNTAKALMMNSSSSQGGYDGDMTNPGSSSPEGEREENLSGAGNKKKKSSSKKNKNKK